MTLRDDHELAVTLRKLAILEAQYEKTAREPSDDPHLKELGLRSARRIINQLKEEVARYRAGIRPDNARPRGIETDEQLANTRRKLQALEQQLAHALARPSENARVHELSVRSLKRTINQLKEEIVRYEAKSRVA